ncbi:STAS domain-containing protein [Streptomyces sp. NPDC048643]|uniref:STAS domain-containing protein n=1 Tax=Streptomyces sp. NPDC048643 TaxID=3155637 RepID=UPI003424F9BF
MTPGPPAPETQSAVIINAAPSRHPRMVMIVDASDTHATAHRRPPLQRTDRTAHRASPDFRAAPRRAECEGAYDSRTQTRKNAAHELQRPRAAIRRPCCTCSATPMGLSYFEREDVLRSAMDETSGKMLPAMIIDLSALAFGDTAFLHWLLTARRAHQEAGTCLILAGPLHSLVTRLLTITGTIDCFLVAEDVDAALVLADALCGVEQGK